MSEKEFIKIVSMIEGIFLDGRKMNIEQVKCYGLSMAKMDFSDVEKRIYEIWNSKEGADLIRRRLAPHISQLRPPTKKTLWSIPHEDACDRDIALLWIEVSKIGLFSVHGVSSLFGKISVRWQSVREKVSQEQLFSMIDEVVGEDSGEISSFAEKIKERFRERQWGESVDVAV